MTVLGIIQARCGSTRLPQKVLADLAGKPMLARVVGRLRRAHTVDTVIVATSDREADGPIAELARAEGWHCFRGSENDVLSRFFEAAQPWSPDVVVRITADCPLLDPQVVDAVVEALHRDGADYASNVLPPRTYPRGLDVEAFRFDALTRAHREDRDSGTREHVTPFLYSNPDRFRLSRVASARDLSHHRWTVDTPEDLDLIRRIYAALDGSTTTYTDVLRVAEDHPEWASINAHVEQKKIVPKLNAT